MGPNFVAFIACFPIYQEVYEGQQSTAKKNGIRFRATSLSLSSCAPVDCRVFAGLEPKVVAWRPIVGTGENRNPLTFENQIPSIALPPSAPWPKISKSPDTLAFSPWKNMDCDPMPNLLKFLSPFAEGHFSSYHRQ